MLLVPFTLPRPLSTSPPSVKTRGTLRPVSMLFFTKSLSGEKHIVDDGYYYHYDIWWYELILPVNMSRRDRQE